MAIPKKPIPKNAPSDSKSQGSKKGAAGGQPTRPQRSGSPSRPQRSGSSKRPAKARPVSNPYDDGEEEVFSSSRGTQPPQRKPRKKAPTRPSRPRPAPVNDFEDSYDDYDSDSDYSASSNYSSGEDYGYEEDYGSDSYSNDYDNYDDEYDDVGFEDTEEEELTPAPPARKRRPSRSARPTPPSRMRNSAPDFDDEDDDEEFGDYEAYYDAQMEKLEGEERDEVEKNKKAFMEKDIPPEEVKKAARRRKKNEKARKKKGIVRGRKNKKDNTGGDVYADEENFKLEPFAKRKVKVSEFDGRSNKQKKATYIRWGVIGLIGALVLLGIKNALIPPYTMTPEEVQGISLETVGETNFPKERGRGLAENFVKAYLTVGHGDVAQQALDYFYTGAINQEFTPESMEQGVMSNSDINSSTINGKFEQKVITDPIAYQSVSVDDNSGYYIVGALVKPDASQEKDQYGKTPKTSGSEARWVFFQVNVYYDDAKDKLYITKDSPTLVPDVNMGAVADAPKMGKLGNGEELEDNTVDAISPVIYNYISGYAKSTQDDYSAIQQYLAPDAEETAKSGLGGDYELAGDNENAIELKGYSTNDPNMLKFLATVTWKNTITEEGSTEELASVTYDSNYVVTLTKGEDGRWEVQNFNSYTFVPDDDALERQHEDEAKDKEEQEKAANPGGK